MAFKPVTDSRSFEKFRFENVGDVIEGHYLGSDVIEINESPVTRHMFKTDGGHLSPLGSSDLDRKLSLVQPGTLTRVTFNGKIKLKGGKTMKEFNVEIDEDNRIPVANEKTLG